MPSLTKEGRIGEAAERATAERLGAKRTPASGALSGAKGDFTTKEFRMENKATEKDSLPILLTWLQKITHEALHSGKIPALSFQFVFGSGKPKQAGSWVMVPEWWFKEKIEDEANRGDQGGA